MAQGPPPVCERAFVACFLELERKEAFAVGLAVGEPEGDGEGAGVE